MTLRTRNVEGATLIDTSTYDSPRSNASSHVFAKEIVVLPSDGRTWQLRFVLVDSPGRKVPHFDISIDV